jgi:shikimate kinase
MRKENIILIGMPASGKSSAGILLAKAMGLNFLDTDVVIQAQQGRLLQDLLDADGLAAFLAIEKMTVLGLSPIATVVATGGSVIYSAEAMAHLAATGIVIYLETSFDELVRRLGNIAERGVAIPPGMSIDDLYAQRTPSTNNTPMRWWRPPGCRWSKLSRRSSRPQREANPDRTHQRQHLLVAAISRKHVASAPTNSSRFSAKAPTTKWSTATISS